MKERELSEVLIEIDQSWPDRSRGAYDAATIASNARRRVRQRRRILQRMIAGTTCLLMIVSIAAIFVNLRADRTVARSNPEANFPATVLLRTQVDSLERDAQ